MTDGIRRVAIIGAGVIGAGWAARVALNGIDVAVYDPDRDAGARITRALEAASRCHAQLSALPFPEPGRILFRADLAEVVSGAGFIQESVPEHEAAKRALLAEVSRLAMPGAIIASSSSGLLPSRLQADCVAPERVCIGHPFNPVYLLPLVEVVGGAATGAGTLERAAAFYRGLGMHPLVLTREIDAFIADRLLEAVWREALHLVNDGIATVDEIDQAITYGPGLRWSVMGTFLLYRLAGGESGMAHFLRQFGPTLALPWTRMEGPALTDALVAQIVAQSDLQAAGRSIGELERLRDDCLVGVLTALRRNDHGAGAVLRRHEDARRATMAVEAPDLPLRIRSALAAGDSQLTDDGGCRVFTDATESLLQRLGIDSAYRSGGGYRVAESCIRCRRAARPGESVTVTTRLLADDGPTLKVLHHMVGGGDRDALATAELTLVHGDATGDGISLPAPALRARIAALIAAQMAGGAVMSPPTALRG